MFGYACLDAGFNISQVSRSYGLSKTNEALHLKTSKFWPRENGNNNSDCYKTDPKMPDVSVFNFLVIFLPPQLLCSRLNAPAVSM